MITKEYLLGRQAIYEYLYMAYYNVPDAAFVDLSRKFLPVFEGLGAETGGELVSGAKSMSVYLNTHRHMTDEELAVRLNVEFTKLFIKGDSKIWLTENLWRAAEKAKTDIILSVSGYFADAGIIKPTAINMPIDSYSMELFYLYRTSRAAAKSEGEARDKILSAQSSFIKEHILCWTDMFKHAIIEQTDGMGFYSSIARLSNGFIKYSSSN